MPTSEIYVAAVIVLYGQKGYVSALSFLNTLVKIRLSIHVGRVLIKYTPILRTIN